MKYIKFSGGNGYCGCDWEEFHAFDDDVDTRTLDATAWELANDYAESYEYLAEGYDSCGGWESEEAEEEYRESITGYWQEITEEEYRDGLAD